MRPALLLLALLAGCARDPVPPLSRMALPASAGQPLDLTEYQGKVVLIEVWATWCHVCRNALPLYRVLYDELKPQGFEVLGVSVDEDPAALEAYLSTVAPGFPIVRDPTGVVPHMLGVKALPTAFLFDRRGDLRWSRAGFVPGDLWELRDWSISLLSEKPDLATSVR